MSKEDKIREFDPNGVGAVDAGIFGLPFSLDESEVVILPVPWEVTVSYGAGTAKGPKSVLKASPQLDLYDEDFPDAWKLGMAIDDIPKALKKGSKRFRKKAEKVIDLWESGSDLEDPKMRKLVEEVNTACAEMVKAVKERASRWLDEGKGLVLLGGDHSTPLGYLQALAERHKSFGILQIDAHADLRIDYEGFVYSHASIMHNALKLPQVSKLVQVGIRDYCDAEAAYAATDDRIELVSDRSLKRGRFQGLTWEEQCADIVDSLPEKVYVSFDIDGLDPRYCPGTGTPVPGGLDFEEATYLIAQVVKSGRRLVGADLVEVAPSVNDEEWNANVGARMLYRMCLLLAESQGRKG